MLRLLFLNMVNNVALLNRAVELKVRNQQALKGLEAGLPAFAEHLVRMKEYDANLLPASLKDIVAFTKTAPEKVPAHLFSQFGAHRFYFPNDFFVNAENKWQSYKKAVTAIKQSEPFRHLLDIPIPKDQDYNHNFKEKLDANFDSALWLIRGPMRDAIAKRNKGGWARFDEPLAHLRTGLIFDGPANEITVPSQLTFPGFEFLLYTFPYSIDSVPNFQKADIVGLYEKNLEFLTDMESGYPFPILGTMSLNVDFKETRNRFRYIFQQSPATEKEIIETLKVLNNFTEENVDWRLKERVIEELKPIKGAQIWYDEAREAQKQGLFSDIKIYELLGKKMPKDPVIVGIDPFGQKYPIFYWAGDKGIKQK